MKFLLIDNNIEIIDSIKQLILNVNPAHEIETSHSSYDAMQKIKKYRYDVILTEIYLSGIKGNQILEGVKGKTFKIGFANQLESPMMRQPFNLFIKKPINKEKILDAIKKSKVQHRIQHRIWFLKRFYFNFLFLFLLLFLF